MTRACLGVSVAWMGLGLVAGRPDLSAQETPPGEYARVFLDCQTSACDFDLFRREIAWVDWVRDREDADVQILVTGTSAGGGILYQIDFLGLGEIEGRDLSLSHLSSSTDTSDERREALGERIKVGLTGYAAATQAGEGLTVDFTDPNEGDDVAGPEDDPWNLWVFTVQAGGSYSGQTGVKGTSVNGSITAARTSEDWKLRFRSTLRYSEDEFEFGDGDDLDVLTSVSRTQDVEIVAIRSLGPRWGVGVGTEFESSTYSNYDARVLLLAAAEFNIFPYEESSRRTFTFQYQLGPQIVRYDEETVFEKTEETLFEHSLTAALGLRQPWGNVSASLAAASFVDDFEKNRLSAFGNVSFRIVRGLSLSLYGSASRVRDQINLPQRDATQDQVLLRRRILETDFTSYVQVSLSYTFGSIFNNIVNPRLD